MVLVYFASCNRRTTCCRKLAVGEQCKANRIINPLYARNTKSDNRKHDPGGKSSDIVNEINPEP